MTDSALLEARPRGAQAGWQVGRQRGPTTRRSRLAEVFLATVQASAEGWATVTSAELSQYAGHSAAQVRRDLQAIGMPGRRGVGYDVRGLLTRLEALPTLRGRPVALVDGSGFGVALRESVLLKRLGFRFDIVFGSDILSRASASESDVLPLSRIPEELYARRIEIAVLAAPPAEMEGAYKLLYQSGVRLVITFGEQLLEKRPNVTVHYAHSVDRLLRTMALWTGQG